MPCTSLLGRFALALLLAAVFATPAAAFKRTFKGEALKDFELPSLAGESLRLTEHLGEKATVLIFWASWSPRSAEALGEFQSLYAEHRAAGLQVLAVNVEQQELESAQQEALAAFVATQQLSYPVLVDEGLAVFDRYGVIAVPSLVLADAGGTVLELLEGYSNMTRDDFRDRVLEALGVFHPEQEKQAGEVGAYSPVGTSARYYQMGGLFLHKKMVGRAVKALRRAVQEDPNYTAAYVRLAEALELLGEEAAAAVARQQAATLGMAPSPAAEATESRAAVDNPGAVQVEERLQAADVATPITSRSEPNPEEKKP